MCNMLKYYSRGCFEVQAEIFTKQNAISCQHLPEQFSESSVIQKEMCVFALIRKKKYNLSSQ